MSDAAAGAFHCRLRRQLLLEQKLDDFGGAGFVKIHGREIRQCAPRADDGEAVPKVWNDPGARPDANRNARAGRANCVDRVRDIGFRERLAAVFVANVDVNAARAAATEAYASVACCAGVIGMAGCSARVRVPLRAA